MKKAMLRKVVRNEKKGLRKAGIAGGRTPLKKKPVVGDENSFLVGKTWGERVGA